MELYFVVREVGYVVFVLSICVFRVKSVVRKKIVDIGVEENKRKGSF